MIVQNIPLSNSESKTKYFKNVEQEFFKLQQVFFAKLFNIFMNIKIINHFYDQSGHFYSLTFFLIRKTPFNFFCLKFAHKKTKTIIIEYELTYKAVLLSTQSITIFKKTKKSFVSISKVPFQRAVQRVTSLVGAWIR